MRKAAMIIICVIKSKYNFHFYVDEGRTIYNDSGGAAVSMFTYC